MVSWDWEASPTYESERIRIDGMYSPVVLYDMRRPRQVEDHEIDLMLSIADYHLDRELPFISLVRHTRGTGVISSRHRQVFANWLEARGQRLERDDFGVVVVLPEAIFRAVLRVVYRFRTPPLRTITTPDVSSAADAVRAELGRIGQRPTPEVDAFLQSLVD